MPGKLGDQLWSLPTARALAAFAGEPVSFLVSPKYSSLIPLLQAQPYLGTVGICPTWEIHEGGRSPMSPWSPFDDDLHHLAFPDGATVDEYDHVVHLGYRDWPDRPLPYCVEAQTRREYPELAGFPPIDLASPWIRPTYHLAPKDLAIGFSDEHFELKTGLYWLLVRRLVERRDPPLDYTLLSNSPRWNAEHGTPQCDWLAAAAWLQSASVFVGCNSGLHVLARAVGTPVIMLEPDAARHNAIFFPQGKTGGGVELVLGNDGQPTFDARHLMDAIEAALAKPKGLACA
jgi:hypothetical protein